MIPAAVLGLLHYTRLPHDKPVANSTLAHPPPKRTHRAAEKHAADLMDRQPQPVSHGRLFERKLPWLRPMLGNKPPPKSVTPFREAYDNNLRTNARLTQEEIVTMSSLRNQTYNPDLPLTGRNGAVRNWRIEWSRSLPRMEPGAELILPSAHGAKAPQQGPWERQNYVSPWHPPHELMRPSALVPNRSKAFKGVYRVTDHVSRPLLSKV